MIYATAVLVLWSAAIAVVWSVRKIRDRQRFTYQIRSRQPDLLKHTMPWTVYHLLLRWVAILFPLAIAAATISQCVRYQ